MAGTVKRRPIIAICVVVWAVVGLAPAPASPPERAMPQRVEGGDGWLYCTLAWIFLCHAQPSCTPGGCKVRLPSWGF
jgi:hypothetical protein